MDFLQSINIFGTLCIFFQFLGFLFNLGFEAFCGVCIVGKVPSDIYLSALKQKITAMLCYFPPRIDAVELTPKVGKVFSPQKNIYSMQKVSTLCRSCH